MITNHRPRSAIKKFIFSFLLLASFAACDNKTDSGSTTNTVATTDATPSTADQTAQQEQQQRGTNLLGTHLDTLKLDSSSYMKLRAKFPPSALRRSKLVVQFYFNSARPRNPTLIAYAAKPGNQFSPNPYSVKLENAGPAFKLPEEFVLGDQQIRFQQIDGIIGNETDFILYFIPLIRPGEINVRYNICISKRNGAVTCLAPPPATQPSPPADTN
jgi:hypothetical protein